MKRDVIDCSGDSQGDALLGLRIASIFIIYVGSSCGALFPVLARRSKFINVPKSLFDFAKFFGSGVIIATAFIHLLAPALDELGSPCLSEAWSEYPYALALCLLSIFSIFILELVAFRWGTALLAKIGVHHDAHGHDTGSHAAHGPEGNISNTSKDVEASPSDMISSKSDEHQHRVLDSAISQVIGVAILEFGVVLHSVLIGLTLAVNEGFKVLFVVLVFHQTFEGLGIGSRLAYMKLPSKYNFVPIIGAVIYGFTTPIGIAVGLGLRTTYNPNSATASIVSGVLDSLSSGILIYTGLVELLAHEFLFNKEMMESSNARLTYALGSMLLGCGVMALLGKWA
ncbi:ZIP-like iron-zinc transporter [Lentinula aff. detonsa]|uniref:ZIP-like iron-zinc transporter n=1 Tax=Lentinula aff. detonsa TaxID=2804958 RepID=A0AA38KVH5_9AGAR|nr:ZIP-like iron-zinc transporter [Lentinula aff. detonsa]KAJ3799853.1 ZIP-like iron-zinc transporter [Lentinula aff. detonsa]